jgi:hypothetical protein
MDATVCFSQPDFMLGQPADMFPIMATISVDHMSDKLDTFMQASYGFGDDCRLQLQVPIGAW